MISSYAFNIFSIQCLQHGSRYYFGQASTRRPYGFNRAPSPLIRDHPSFDGVHGVQQGQNWSVIILIWFNEVTNCRMVGLTILGYLKESFDLGRLPIVAVLDYEYNKNELKRIYFDNIQRKWCKLIWMNTWSSFI